MTSKNNAVLVSDLFAQLGGEFVVISPGSRNAPLIKCFQSFDSIQCVSIVDERSAAFFALGISLATKKPVALVCTSGTALLNYSPAIAEAYYLGVPLIVISADRPGIRIDKGEGQSIRQQNVYQNFQKGFLNIEEEHCFEKEIVEKSKNILLNAISEKHGPVHFNLPFSEPLYEESENNSKFDNVNFDTAIIETNLKLDLVYIERWNKSKRKLVLCGRLEKSNKLNQALIELSKNSDIIILFESVSNLDSNCGIGTIDRTLSALSIKDIQPDLVVTLGEHIISKRIKEFLKRIKNLEHWHISDNDELMDTFECKSLSIKTTAELFLENINYQNIQKGSDYSNTWKTNELIGKNLHNEFLLNVPFSDLQVFDIVLNAIPNNFHLQSGNSSVIRYIQLFDYNQWKSCHANRGTSGIEGSTSTAVGFSFAAKEPTLLITGDISFLYDSNGLWNNSIRSDFRIIVINNGGGGIFRFIPGPETVPNHEEFFETTHNIDLQHIAKAFGFDFGRADNKNELIESLESFFIPSIVPKILEIRTPRKLNSEILKEYFSYIEKNK